jgi:putative heme-binding domain-containing protein
VEAREYVLRLAGDWKLESFIPELVRVAESEKETNAMRLAAFDALRAIGGDSVKSRMKTLSESEQDTWGRQHAIQTWASLDLNAASGAAVSLLTKMKEKEAEEFWKSLLTIKDSGAALAKALPKSGLPVPMAKAGLRVARSAGKNEPDLVWALTRGANLEEDSQTLTAAELRDLSRKSLESGDPARGELIFRRKDISCMSCHAIGGVGGKVGPDLTSIGASAQMDYLIESVLYPNRKIKEGYHTVIVETKDGEEYSGVLATENSDKVVLRDASGKDREVLKKDIKNRSTGGSIMPSGLVDALTPAERMDLYRFLSELGKPGPFDAAKSRVARAWKLMPQTLDLAQFGDDKVLGTKLSDSKWESAVGLVDGRLLKQELSSRIADVESRDPRAIYAATQFEVAKSGPIDLKIEGPAHAQLWVDGKPAGTGSELQPKVESGKHVAILKLDSKNLPDSLRLRSDDVTFLAE